MMPIRGRFSERLTRTARNPVPGPCQCGHQPGEALSVVDPLAEGLAGVLEPSLVDLVGIALRDLVRAGFKEQFIQEIGNNQSPPGRPNETVVADTGVVVLAGWGKDDHVIVAQLTHDLLHISFVLAEPARSASRGHEERDLLRVGTGRLHDLDEVAQRDAFGITLVTRGELAADFERRESESGVGSACSPTDLNAAATHFAPP